MLLCLDHCLCGKRESARPRKVWHPLDDPELTGGLIRCADKTLHCWYASRCELTRCNHRRTEV